MNIKLVNIMSICLILLCFQSKSQDINQLREAFKKAEHFAMYGGKLQYLNFAPSIAGYPLAPYAEAQYLTRNMSLSSKQRILSLIKQYPDAPFTKPLLKKWLTFLANKQLRYAFLESYRDIGDTRLQCLNLTWRWQGGADRKDIMNKVGELWLSAYSQPKACDYLFGRWQNQGLMTQDIIKQRIKLAAKKKNFALMAYLKTKLDTSAKHLPGLWKSVVNKPSTIDKAGFFLLFDQDEKDVFLFAMKKLIFRSVTKSQQLWQQLAGRFQLSNDEQTQIEKQFAIAYALAKDDQSLQWLLSVPDEFVDETIKQWRLAYSLQQGDWQQTMAVIDSLPEHMQASESVFYWRARALEQLGHQQWAEASYKELAERRDYYGFLAAQKLGIQANLRHQPAEIEPWEFNQLRSNLVAQRAHELFRLGRIHQARQEWNLLTAKLTDREKLTAAHLAYEWGWYDRPIFIMADIGYLNDVNLRFPLAYKALLSEQAESNNLAVSLLFAIARRESSFMPDAYSDAGAAGLMQLKPSTAGYVQKRRVNKQQLFKPQSNIKIGTQYLSYLLDKSSQNPVLAAAAYNAGINRVKKWLPKEPMPADVWIETIPYKETRNYVKAIVAYTQVYQQLLDTQENPFRNTSELGIYSELSE